MSDVLETACPACDTDFQFDLSGSWDDFPCPHCATMLELEVEDWLERDEDGEVVDDGVDYTVVLAPSQRASFLVNEYVDLTDRDAVNQRTLEGLTHNPPEQQ